MADFGVTEALAVAAVVAAAGSAYATYASGQNRAAGEDYNARLYEQQAQQARDAAKVDAEVQAEAARRAQATTRARAAASGVEMNEGSPLLVIMDNARQASLENQRILYGGELRASGLESSAALSRFQGRQYGTAGSFGAGLNLLSGIGNAGRQYLGRAPRLAGLSGGTGGGGGGGYGSAFEG